MKRFREWFFGVLLLVVILLFFLGRCGERKDRIEYVYRTDTVRDLRVVRDTFYSFHYKTVAVPVPVEVDTAGILSAYFERHYYSDTLKNDSDAFIRVDELVTENLISSRELTFINRRPTEIINKVEVIPKENERREFSFGAALLFKDREFEPGLRVGIRQKRVSYDFTFFPLSGAVMMGVDFNVKVK
jgi:hypothetical protein